MSSAPPFPNLHQMLEDAISVIGGEGLPNPCEDSCRAPNMSASCEALREASSTSSSSSTSYLTDSLNILLAEDSAFSCQASNVQTCFGHFDSHPPPQPPPPPPPPPPLIQHSIPCPSSPIFYDADHFREVNSPPSHYSLDGLLHGLGSSLPSMPPLILLPNTRFSRSEDFDEDTRSISLSSSTSLSSSSQTSPKCSVGTPQNSEKPSASSVSRSSSLSSRRRRRRTSSSCSSNSSGGGNGGTWTHPCGVCGSRSGQHCHYGANVGVCDSCRVFFRRAVQSGNNRKFSCAGLEKCGTRDWSSCQLCRYQSCLRVGMKTDSVLNAYHKRQRAAERERGSMLQSNHITSSQFLRQNSSGF